MKKDYLLSKWLNNDITNEELKQLKASPEYASYIKIAEATSQLQTPKFDKEKNFDAINSKKKQLQTKVVKLNPIKTILKIAAVFAVLFAGYFYTTTLDTTINTQIAQNQTFLLPDDSEVVLNANSSIIYNKNNWKNKRELTLNGEAYFKVSKGQKFSIKTNDGVVSVLGTQFNVFSRDHQFFVNCYEGLVSVVFNDTLIKLPAGNYLKIDSGNIIAHQTASVTSPSWINNESSFDNVRLSSVIKELEIQFPIKVTTKKINLNQRFTGSFSHKDLNLALTLICEPLNLSFSIDKKGDVTLYAKEN
ncbi:MAG: FecR family protein [Flavobacteriaceae bacterium]|nr:FecR family protein [Flavobacteriaceae bacterium]